MIHWLLTQNTWSLQSRGKLLFAGKIAVFYFEMRESSVNVFFLPSFVGVCEVLVASLSNQRLSSQAPIYNGLGSRV